MVMIVIIIIIISAITTDTIVIIIAAMIVIGDDDVGGGCVRIDGGKQHRLGKPRAGLRLRRGRRCGGVRGLEMHRGAGAGA